VIDRRKAAIVLVLVGAGLAVLGSFQETYSGAYDRGPEPYTTTLWTVTSKRPVNTPTDAYYANGYPMIVAVALMVAAVVLLARGGKAATIARPVVLAAAGGLAGIVLTYVVQLLREEKLYNSLQADGLDYTYTVTFLAGTYLLVAGAVIGLVGAALAQQRQSQPVEADDEEDEEVVVHQLGSDDDTPPFGIAIVEQEKEQEAR
jgi:hypothetical protein